MKLRNPHTGVLTPTPKTQEQEKLMVQLRLENEELKEKQAVMQKALDDLIFSSMGGGGI